MGPFLLEITTPSKFTAQYLCTLYPCLFTAYQKPSLLILPYGLLLSLVYSAIALEIYILLLELPSQAVVVHAFLLELLYLFSFFLKASLFSFPSYVLNVGLSYVSSIPFIVETF